MLKVLLICSQGASTGALCDKISKAAEAKNMDLDIHAVAIAQCSQDIKNAEVILLGPQVRYMLKKISAEADGKPVEAIDMTTYGMMDGAKVLDQILRMAGK